MRSRTAVLSFLAVGTVISVAGLGCASATRVVAAAPSNSDRYANYADLEAHEREFKDYQVLVSDLELPRTVIAIHGGWMERGTSELARAVTMPEGRPDRVSADWNLYLFEADRLELHLTSTRFDEPRAVALVGRSRAVLSIHGFFQGEKAASIACVGGRDAAGARRVVKALEARAAELRLRVEYPCERFGGGDPANIVNRGIGGGGVQLELSRPLRERILKEPGLVRQLATVIRTAF